MFVHHCKRGKPLAVAVRSRQHAKLAVADRRTLFLSSADLTESAVRRTIEAGVLVTGGEAPRRAAEHIVELQRLGELRRFRSNEGLGPPVSCAHAVGPRHAVPLLHTLVSGRCRCVGRRPGPTGCPRSTLPGTHTQASPDVVG